MGIIGSILSNEALRLLRPEGESAQGPQTKTEAATPQANPESSSVTVGSLPKLPTVAKRLKSGAAQFFSQVAEWPTHLSSYAKTQVARTEARTQELFTQVDTALQSGDTATAEKALKIAQGQIDLLAQAEPKGEKSPKIRLLRAQGEISAAGILDVKEEGEAARSHYHRAVQILDEADANTLLVSSYQPKILSLRADAKHQLRDYAGARMDRFWAAQGMDMSAKTAERRYEAELSELADTLEFQAFFAQESGDRSAEAGFVAEAIRVNEALGREEVAATLETYLKELSQEVLPQQVKLQARDQAKTGILTEEELAYFPELSGLVSVEENAAGETQLVFSEKFAALSESERTAALEKLQQAGVAGTFRLKAQNSENEVEQFFYQSKLDLMNGNVAAAKVHLRLVHKKATDSKDPLEQRYCAEADQQLRAFTMAHLDQLQARNEILKGQRSSHVFKKPAYEVHAQMNIDLVEQLRSYVENGRAVTTDEALQLMFGEEVKARQQTGTMHIPYHNWGNKDLPHISQLAFYYHNMEMMDPEFKLMMDLDSSDHLEASMTPEGQDQTVLEAARGLRARNGSYEISGVLFESLFAEELQTARSEVPQETIDRIERDRRNGFTQYKTREGIEARLKALKENDPLAFQERYPQGWPTSSEMDALVKQATDAQIAAQVKKQAYNKLDARYEREGLNDEVANAAWAEFKDMQDPTDETWNLSDATCDAILDEVVLTAVTLPVTMGAGAAVRGAISTSRWAMRTASASRLGQMTVRGTTFVSGVMVEGAVQELQMGLYTGEAHMKNLGFNLAMSTAFHGGGKLWGRYAKEIGVDATAQQAARAEGRLLAARGQAAVDFSGMLTTQTLLGTFMTDPANQGDMGEAFAASFLRQLGGHAATGTLSRFMPKTMGMENEGMMRQDQYRAIRDEALDLGYRPKRAAVLAEASLNLSQTTPLARAAQEILSKPSSAPAESAPEAYGFKHFSADTVNGLKAFWFSVEGFITPWMGPIGPQLAYATATAQGSRSPAPKSREGLGLLHMFRTAEAGESQSGPAKTQVRVHEDLSRGQTDFLDLAQAQKMAYQKVGDVEQLLFEMQNQLGVENFKLDVKFPKHHDAEGKNFAGVQASELVEMHVSISPNIVMPKSLGFHQTRRYLDGVSEAGITLVREMNSHHEGEVGIYNLAEFLPKLSPKAKTTLERLMNREENYRDFLDAEYQGLYADLAGNFQGESGNRAAKVAEARGQLAKVVWELETNLKNFDMTEEYKLLGMLTPEQRQTYESIAAPLRQGHRALDKKTQMSEVELYTALRGLEGLPDLPKRVQINLDEAAVQMIEYMDKAAKRMGKLEITLSGAEPIPDGEGFIIHYRLRGETTVTDPDSRHGRSKKVQVDETVAVRLSMSHEQAAVFNLADFN